MRLTYEYLPSRPHIPTRSLIAACNRMPRFKSCQPDHKPRNVNVFKMLVFWGLVMSDMVGHDGCAYSMSPRRWRNSDVAYQFLQSIDDIDAHSDLGLLGNPEDMDLSSFGKRLAHARHRTGLMIFPDSKQEIRKWSAAAAKESAIESWESGRRTRITVEALLGLAAAVGWPPICLLVDVFDPDGM